MLNVTGNLASMGSDQMLDKPIHGSENSIFRVNLGHLITVLTLVAGFIVTSQQVKDQVGTVQTDVGDLKTSLKAVTAAIQTNALSMTGLTDSIGEMKRTQEGHDRHFEAVDARLSADETTLRTLDTNMALINQQLQYIGTSHIEPSRKK